MYIDEKWNLFETRQQEKCFLAHTILCFIHPCRCKFRFTLRSRFTYKSIQNVLSKPPSSSINCRYIRTSEQFCLGIFDFVLAQLDTKNLNVLLYFSCQSYFNTYNFVISIKTGNYTNCYRKAYILSRVHKYPVSFESCSQKMRCIRRALYRFGYKI